VQRETIIDFSFNSSLNEFYLHSKTGNHTEILLKLWIGLDKPRKLHNSLSEFEDNGLWYLVQ